MKRFMRAILCAVLLTAVFGVNALAQLPVTNGLECWYDASIGIVEDGSGVLTWFRRTRR